MNSQGFLRIVHQAFEPFLKNLGFLMDTPSISGRFYSVDFTSASHQALVSYEPGDNALFVMVGECQNGRLIDIDDREKTPRLTDLNARYMAMVTTPERTANEAIFTSIATHDDEERLLLKSAKELCLVLPKHLGKRVRSDNSTTWGISHPSDIPAKHTRTNRRRRQ